MKRPRPIDELCSESSDSSNTSDATTARWCETFATRDARSQPISCRKSRRRGCGPTHGRQVYRSPRSDARAITVSPGTQETPVMLKAALLAATACPQANERPTPNDSSAPGGRCHRRPKYRPPPRVRVTGQPYFLGREMQMPPRMRKGEQKHGLKDVGGTGLGGTSAVLVRARYFCT